MMNWHIVTSAEYAAGIKVDDDLYYLSDTQEVYRGSVSYTQAINLYETTLPVNPAKNRLYIEKTTLAGSVWDGTSWTQVVKPLASTVTPEGDAPVTGAAVVSYVAAQLESLASNANTVKNISYDQTEHLVTVTKGDDSTSTIVLNGLGCSLSFAGNKLQLLDASGTKIGAEIDMDVERFVHSGEYNEETKSIILYFNADKTDSVVIPVGDLVDEYTVESTSSINLQMVANKITATLKLSATEGNAAQLLDDGLFVPTVDTSDLMPKIAGGTEGNIPVIGADGTVEDSGVSAAGIGVKNLYTGASIEEAVGEATPNEGDICIVITTIADGKTSRTAYYYKDSQWVAMDGNVNAKNVYFDADLLTTTEVGYITLNNGQATIPATGKNLEQVWETIFVQEKNPVTTQPSVSVSCPQATRYEVGTSVTPTYTATLNPGSYSYDESTGVTATSWAVSDTDSHSATANTGSFDGFVVGDATNYRITATATYGDGIIPKTNKGTPYPTGQILAGSKTGYSGYITGYRAGFYGTVTTKDGEINSALVRALSGKTNAAPAAGNKWTLSIPAGAMRIVFAYPASIRDVSSVIDVGGMNAEIKTAFTKYEVQVEGANGYTAAAYKVYVMDRAEATTGTNTYTITL